MSFKQVESLGNRSGWYVRNRTDYVQRVRAGVLSPATWLLGGINQGVVDAEEMGEL